MVWMERNPSTNLLLAAVASSFGCQADLSGDQNTGRTSSAKSARFQLEAPQIVAPEGCVVASYSRVFPLGTAAGAFSIDAPAEFAAEDVDLEARLIEANWDDCGTLGDVIGDECSSQIPADGKQQHYGSRNNELPVLVSTTGRQVSGTLTDLFEVEAEFQASVLWCQIGAYTPPPPPDCTSVGYEIVMPRLTQAAPFVLTAPADFAPDMIDLQMRLIEANWDDCGTLGAVIQDECAAQIPQDARQQHYGRRDNADPLLISTVGRSVTGTLTDLFDSESHFTATVQWCLPADQCPDDPEKTTPGLCGCGLTDVDSDGDGAPDCGDACPTDPAKTTPLTCGCGVREVDSDGDGTPDCAEEPQAPRKSIYLVTRDQVARFFPDTREVIPLTPGSPWGFSDIMTDIAIAYDGEIVALAYNNLYRFNRDWTREHVGTLSYGWTSPVSQANSLEFHPDGRLFMGNRSSLVLLSRENAGGYIFSDIGPNVISSGDISLLPDGYLYMTTQEYPAPDGLWRIDPATGVGVRVGSTGFDNVYGLAYLEGVLYGFTFFGQVITIDPTTGAGTPFLQTSYYWHGATIDPTE